jgi:hypothetical protein
MLPTCFKCGHKISLSWFNFAFNWTQFRCVECSSLHEPTNRRKFIGALAGGGGFLLFKILETVLDSGGLRLLIVMLTIFILIPLIPGQHRQVQEEENHNQAQKKDADKDSAS